TARSVRPRVRGAWALRWASPDRSSSSREYAGRDGVGVGSREESGRGLVGPRALEKRPAVPPLRSWRLPAPGGIHRFQRSALGPVVPPIPPMPPTDLELGRRAFEQREWRTAFDRFNRADAATPLAVDDLWRLALAAHLAGRDEVF